MEEDNELEQLNEGIDKAGEDIASDAPRISWGEILLITPLLMFVDFVELMGTVMEAIPVAGQVVLLPVSLILSGVSLLVTFFVQFYLFIKKVKNFAFLIGSIIDSVPVISALPIRTVSWLITVFMTNNKKVSKLMNNSALGKAASIATKI